MIKKDKNKRAGQLFVVATPIGNLDDISLRALNVLAEVDFVACEDTRVTKKILFAFDLKKELVSFHQHSQLQKIDWIKKRLLKGESCALLTDAGTPGISDPGGKLVEAAIKENVPVVPIPGASALTTLLSVAGDFSGTFLFLGFPPHKKGRKKFFSEISQAKRPVLIYESSHRIIKTLTTLTEKLPTAELVVGRELTKLFETIYRGRAGEIKKTLAENAKNQKGEFTILIKLIKK